MAAGPNVGKPAEQKETKSIPQDQTEKAKKKGKVFGDPVFEIQ